MLIIKATFPDGNEQNFGKPEDLRRYMKEEGYVEAHINAQFIYDVFVNMRMTADEIERWIDMKTEIDTKIENGLQSGNFDRPTTK